MSWTIQIVCTKCGFIGDQEELREGVAPSLQVPRDCPNCAKKEAPVGASRFTIWRHARRFRKLMRDERRMPHFGS